MIYFIRFTDEPGYIKIGHSQNPLTRLAQISCCCPYSIELYAACFGHRDLEQHIHWLFRDHQVFSEWFKPNPDLSAFVRPHLLPVPFAGFSGRSTLRLEAARLPPKRSSTSEIFNRADERLVENLFQRSALAAPKG